MKKPINKGVQRSVRLDKGYKTRLKDWVRKNGFGSISKIAGEAQIHRETVSRIVHEGKCNKSNKEKIQAFIDANQPLPKKINYEPAVRKHIA